MTFRGWLRPANRSSLATTGLLALVVLSRALGAQTLHGTVRDSLAHRPIPGAVVALLDSSGATLSRSLTNEQGQFRVSLTATAARLRVIRIGFRPNELPVRRAGVVPDHVDILLAALQTFLTPVIVTDGSRCARRSDRALAYGMWEQARAGLLATIVARDTKAAGKLRFTYTQTMKGATDQIVRNVVRADSSGGAGASFSAVRSARDFVRLGFTADSLGLREFFGPDAEALLDDAFLSAYCLNIAKADPARGGQVGLAFAPAAVRRDTVDITGTVWLDTVRHALRDIEFRYLGLERPAERLAPGGIVSFREMPNGIVLIDRWHLRLFGATEDTTVSNGRDVVRQWPFISLTGGELARTVWSDGTEWKAPLGTLHGHATWSTGKPAGGIVVVLEETDYRTVTDSTGAFTIVNLVPGPYPVVIDDPRLAPLAVQIPTRLRFVATRDATSAVTLTVPTAEEYVIERCRSDRRWIPGTSSFVVGRVFDAAGIPAARASVELSLKQGGGTWQDAASFSTGTDGFFESCSNRFTPGATVRATAQLRNGRTVEVTHRISANLTVIKMRLD